MDFADKLDLMDDDCDIEGFPIEQPPIMPDLTPLEAAERIEEHNSIHYAKEGERAHFITQALTMAASYLRKIASGEYAPVVHAHWINYYEPLCSNPHANCSRCGHLQTFDEHEGKAYAPKYCENCAALMIGKDDSHEID